MNEVQTMTKYHQELIQCPVCFNEENMTIWDVIDAVSDPDLRERLLRKTLQTFECRNCGTGTPLALPLMYEDAGHKLRIESRPDLPGRPELLARLDALNRWPRQPGWQLRLTGQTNELIEKIHLREHGLDDRAMALVKLAVQNNSTEADTIAELYFSGIKGEEMMFVVGMADGEWFQMFLPMEAYRNAGLVMAGQLDATAEGWQLIDQVYAQSILDGYKTID
jgi:hypothetical protein